VVILTEGGLTTRWSAVRPAVPLAVVLSTLGVAVSVAVTAGAAVLLLDTSWRTGLLLGAIVSSTDAAAVFSTLRVLGLPPRLTATLEMESGFNDAPVIILVVMLSSGATGSPVEVFALITYELLAGAVIGLAVAFGAAWLLRRGALPVAGLYPLSILAVAVGSYAVSTVAHASGFLAAYLTGLVLGNVHLPHRHATVGFVEGLAWLAQIGLFVLLGLLVTPSRLGPALLPALGFGAVLLLLARPLSVVASAVWFRVRWAEQVFVSWAGLRGAVPIVLTTIPLTAGAPEARRFFDIVFVIVLVYTLVQGTTLAPLARLLRLSSASEPRDLEVDSRPLTTWTPTCCRYGSRPRRGCTACWCASCGCRPAPCSRCWSATARGWCRGRRPGCAGRPAAGRHDRAGAGRGRAAAARGRPGRPARGWLEGRHGLDPGRGRWDRSCGAVGTRKRDGQ
jgi:cell volume regulation protein A